MVLLAAAVTGVLLLLLAGAAYDFKIRRRGQRTRRSAAMFHQAQESRRDMRLSTHFAGLVAGEPAGQVGHWEQSGK